ncbi:hypothetical protein COX84_00265 [Candidatus Micrarchaeota archaeon CG_4_10_14_0_2_um_filter_49_7]|nr:MAG: hypothetical protein AUJ13_01305 [Candidatus Micrarchaeota archaeon CG1_02_49_24]PIZ99998.1 MAG: hypothetical protein COX84_00265 [Candidatus Micrarchaeota archaeon CG_4_10_14_0_2_um_filter_49_7]HII53354.1 hypothetical protein [Candidatus Micrarchaeota archaeon]
MLSLEGLLSLLVMMFIVLASATYHADPSQVQDYLLANDFVEVMGKAGYDLANANMDVATAAEINGIAGKVKRCIVVKVDGLGDAFASDNCPGESAQTTITRSIYSNGFKTIEITISKVTWP